jgi:hypothetical protein
MKTKMILSILALSATCALIARQNTPSISGHYLEVRSCDVYTGACIANSEMGTGGREGMLVWSIGQGIWNGTALDGLNVIAVVQTADTLGDIRYQTGQGRAVLLVDERATPLQREALAEFARAKAGKLIKEVVSVKSTPMQVTMGRCASGSCATVKAGDVVEISTRCLGGKDHLCGNEENYYPPLTDVHDAFTAFTELAAFKGEGLNTTWVLTGKRSAYLGSF